MAVMDEFREERALIKQGTRKQKYQYFKDYYFWPLLLTTIAVVFVVALCYQIIAGKTTGFYAGMLNASGYQDNQWFTDEFVEMAQIPTKKQTVYMDSGMYFEYGSSDEETMVTVQKMNTRVGAGQMDVLMGTKDAFSYYANSGMLADLREMLTEEQVARYKDSFYYVDQAYADEREAMFRAGKDTSTLPIPNPKDPTAMKEPIPVAIYVESSERLNKAYYFRDSEDGIAVGILANTSHPDYALCFIDYLMN